MAARSGVDPVEIASDRAVFAIRPHDSPRCWWVRPVHPDRGGANRGAKSAACGHQPTTGRSASGAGTWVCEAGPMRYRRLGRTALQVSELCLGTMNFGPQTTEDDSFAIMDRALELGINFFDTANRYGGDKGAGATEAIIGRWFAQGGGRREKVVLATKVFGPMTEWPNDGRLSARHIRDGVRRRACGGCRPTTSTSTRCTTSTGPRRGTRSGRRWRRSSSRARSSTSAAATSPAGTSRRRTRPPPAATSSAS